MLLLIVLRNTLWYCVYMICMECCNKTHLSVTLLELYIMNIFSYGNFVQKCAAVGRGTAEVKEV